MASKQSALDMNKQYPTSAVEDYIPSSPQYIPDPDMPVEPWHVNPQEDQSSCEHSGASTTPPPSPAPPASTEPPPSPAPPASPAPPVLPEVDQELPPEKLPETDNLLEEGECEDTSEEEKDEEAPADPWNDTTFDLEAKLLNLDEEGYPKEDRRRTLVQEISQMHRCIDDTNRKMVQMHTSQVNVRRVMGDVLDILDDMKRLEEKEILDEEVQKKISDISEGIKQVHISQEAVKEVIADLRDSIEGNPRSRKRTYYQTIAGDCLEEDERRKQPKISSELNFSYFDKQYGEILDVQRSRTLRKGIRTRFVELHRSGRKWEILNYHMQVICKENDVLKTKDSQDLEAYAEREEAYLMIAVLFKMFKRMDLVSEIQPDYKHFQTLLSTIFQGIMEKKISCGMVFHWLSHQMYWALCEQEAYNLQTDVLTDVILLYREFCPTAKPPYETDPGLFHHIPELHSDELLINTIETKCSDIMARYCWCMYHSEFPMKFGDSHKFLSFHQYKLLHEEYHPQGEPLTQAKLHQGYVDSTIMRVLHDIHGLVTPFGPDILLQEERRSQIHQSCTPQELEKIKTFLGLASANKHLDLDKAMETMKWYKEATCPCLHHTVRRGGQMWILKPSTIVPHIELLQLPALSESTLIRGGRQEDIDQFSTSVAAETATMNSDVFSIDLNNATEEMAALDEEVEQMNKPAEQGLQLKIKELFQKVTLNQLFLCDHMGVMETFCNNIMQVLVKSKPLDLMWKKHLDEDVEDVIKNFQKQMYLALGAAYGEMQEKLNEENTVEEEEVDKEIEDID